MFLKNTNLNCPFLIFFWGSSTLTDMILQSWTDQWLVGLHAVLLMVSVPESIWCLTQFYTKPIIGSEILAPDIPSGKLT